MATVRRLAPSALLVAALAAALSACSGPAQPAAQTTAAYSATDPLGRLSASQIFSQAMANAAAAPVVQARMTITVYDVPATVDLTIAAGKGCIGTLTYSKSLFYKIIEDGTTVWIQPSDEYYVNVGDSPAVVARLHGKWMNATGTGLAQLAGWCSLPSILNGYLSNTPTGSVTEGTPSTLDGQRVVKLSFTAGFGGDVYASDAVHPQLVRLDGPTGQSAVEFSYPADAPAITPPSASQVASGTQQVTQGTA